jgi:hypothetical protein
MKQPLIANLPVRVVSMNGGRKLNTSVGPEEDLNECDAMKSATMTVIGRLWDKQWFQQVGRVPGPKCLSLSKQYPFRGDVPIPRCNVASGFTN